MHDYNTSEQNNSESYKVDDYFRTHIHLIYHHLIFIYELCRMKFIYTFCTELNTYIRYNIVLHSATPYCVMLCYAMLCYAGIFAGNYYSSIYYNVGQTISMK